MEIRQSRMERQEKSAGGGNEKSDAETTTHRMETTHPTTLPLTFWRHPMRMTIPRMTPTNPRAIEEDSPNISFINLADFMNDGMPQKQKIKKKRNRHKAVDRFKVHSRTT